MGGRLRRNMAGKHRLGRRGAEPHRAQSRHAADKTIHQNGHTLQRAAQKHAAQPGNIKPAQLGQHIQRVSGIGLAAGNAAPDRINLAGKPCIRKPGPASGHALHGGTQQHACHGAGGCGVANAHLPRC